MRTSTLVIVLVCAALVVTGTLVMHGRGHQMLAKWMPALHGR
jgi:preprotein translocase subunit SecG